MPIKENKENRSFASISARSFISVVAVLSAVLIICGVLSYFIPQGSFERDAEGAIILGTYSQSEVSGIAAWRIITAPFRVFVSEDAVTVIMISVFLLIMSGIFNLLEKTGGVRIFIGRTVRRMYGKSTHVLCATVLIFMLFGSFFGMFEELITLLPIIVAFMLSLGLDTMMGLGTCLLATCFGFSAATTNPFSVGLAAHIAGVDTSTGILLRVLFFIITYVLLCGFLIIHFKRIKKRPESSPSYDIDLEKRESLDFGTVEESKENQRTFRAFAIFFGIQAAILLLIASIRTISGYAIPILALSFLVSGIITGLYVCHSPREVAKHISKGAVAMLPAVFMIALASSAKLVMSESGILDTVMYEIISLLENKNPFVAILLIYAITLVLQVFIGSASAKIFLIMPIIMPVATALGLSPALIILAYCMADGFTDVILPTNPVLLVGLSMANVSYVKWLKWTWKLQVVILIISLATLMFGVLVGY